MINVINVVIVYWKWYLLFKKKLILNLKLVKFNDKYILEFMKKLY